jgi:predicted dehydrogenase
MDKIKFAILGAGNIARLMASTVTKMDCIEPYAVASRDASRAVNFAREFGFSKSYGSYEEMLANERVELVYIATPISYHKEHILLCLNSGKHVLCEKAFTVNASQAKEVLDFSKSKKLLLAEAIWPRFMPMVKTLQDFIKSGKIGEIKGLSANLGYSVFHNERLHTPALAGGALLDIGIYPITFASVMLGDDISDIKASAVMSKSGVDEQHTVTLFYQGGQVASLFGTATAYTDRTGAIYGENGYAVVENINNYENLKIYNSENQLIEYVERPPQITGYEYEVLAAVDAIKAGSYECPQMPHSETILIMELMDKIREVLGLRFPMERSA